MESWTSGSSLLSMGLTLAVIVFCKCILIAVFEAIQTFWSLRHFPAPKPPSFLIGHMSEGMTKHKTVQMYRNWCNEYSPIFKIRLSFFQAYLIACHPDSVKSLLMKNDPKDGTYDPLDPWLGGSILLNHGKKWQRSRKLLTPAFHLDILRSYVPISHQCTELLIEKWDSKDGKIVEIYADMKRLTFDILMRCIFSIDTKIFQTEADRHPYLCAVEELTMMTMERTTSALLSLPLVFNVLYGRRFKHLCNVVHEYSRKVIAERKAQLKREKLQQQQGHAESGHDAVTDDGERKSRSKKIDFIDILITSLHEDGTAVEDYEIQPEVDMFMFAGHDTTSSGLTWTLYHLASRQDIQQKCRDEVRALLRDSSEIAYTDLNSLTYLTQCIKESLRLCPPVPYIGRELVEPLELPDGRVIPGGTSVFCGITLLHYNNEIWPNPDVYDPSRFEPQACNDRPPHAYVPFSSGPRNCIGQAFAMNVMKVAVALLLNKYKFAVDVSHEIKFQHDLIMRPKTGLHLFVTPAGNE